MPKYRGFTLIELLVVISILAVLAAIGLTVYTNVLKNARDAKRQSDLRSIQSALEQYYADQRSYPDSLSLLSSDSKVYITTIPKDPRGTNYHYSRNGCGPSSDYCLRADMEGTPPQSDSNCSAFENFDYCVTRP